MNVPCVDFAWLVALAGDCSQRGHRLGELECMWARGSLGVPGLGYPAGWLELEQVCSRYSCGTVPGPPWCGGLMCGKHWPGDLGWSMSGLCQRDSWSYRGTGPCPNALACIPFFFLFSDSWYLMPLVCIGFIALTPVWVLIVKQNPPVMKILKFGWLPIILAMVISR